MQTLRSFTMFGSVNGSHIPTEENQKLVSVKGVIKTITKAYNLGSR